MQQSRFPYRIERTSNRHSRAVLKGDTVVVRLARNLTPTEEHAHTEELLRRMKRTLLRSREKALIDPFRPLLSGLSCHTVRLNSGTEYDFSLVPSTHQGKRKTHAGWEIRVSPSTKQAALHRLLWSAVSSEQLPAVQTLVQQINERTLRVNVRGVRLRIASSQWGSCSSRGNIALNTALLFLPQELLEYVIVHELAHRRHPHHSRSFWECVRTAYPGYEEVRETLRQYRLPMLS
ncbi:MAG: M48 family metallopeptidase [Candidatus Peribacteraceae bacterium]|nr:M48 family metallopeptidase [Candidatus Peribacteraceae bacterium]